MTRKLHKDAFTTKDPVLHPKVFSASQPVITSNRSFRRRRKPAWILGLCLRR